MKIALCSDVHLEFGPLELFNDENADVLILSGDICLASEVNDRDNFEIRGATDRSNQFHKFFQECSARFPHVLYVAGNHEHYHGDYAKSLPRLKEKLAYLKNLHVLDKETFTLEGVTFVGGTLWTDMNKEDPLTLQGIRHKMNDYQIIEDSSELVNYKVYVPKDKPVGMTDEEWLALPHSDRHVVQFKQRVGVFTPEKSVEDHKQMMFAIAAAVEAAPADQKIVVVGHHAPCKQSVKPRYKNDHLVNGAYSSDLSEFMLDNPKIKLWTHGHTHDVFDYMVGSTRIVCNPRGYIGYEQRADDFKLMYVEV